MVPGSQVSATKVRPEYQRNLELGDGNWGPGNAEVTCDDRGHAASACSQ